jgi:pimeloyl-ACP methyl ester carboxylesterase
VLKDLFDDVRLVNKRNDATAAHTGATMRLLPSLVLCLCLSFPLQAQEIVTLPTRDGVTQSFLLTVPADGKLAAAAVLFPGGGGNIRLRLEDGNIRFAPNNFVVRSRNEFVQRGVAAAVMDAPSDQQSGMSDGFRSGSQHAADISAVLADLKKRFPGIPVYLVGTSRGTVSAAYVGQVVGADIAGVVLTSSVYLAGGGRRGQPGLSGFDFSRIKSPLLLVHHRNDGCNVTPYHAAQRLADRYPLVSVTGGKPAISEPCEALSAHGFLGKEPETVEAIVNWMLKKPFNKDIN